MYSSKQKELALRSLKSILQSEGFASAPQLRNFLEFIVGKTLEHQTSEIKGYTIAVDALGRPDNFDPQTDPIVRVMAGRLRQALTNYYSNDPYSHSVLITMPKGSYIPLLEFQSTVKSPGNKNSALVQKLIPDTFSPLLTRLLAVFAVVIASLALWLTTMPTSNNVPLQQNQFHANAARISLSLGTNKDSIPDWFSTDEAIGGLVAAFSRFREFDIFQTPWLDGNANPDANNADYHFSVLIARAGTSQNVRAFTRLTRLRDGNVIWSDVIAINQPDTKNGIDASKISGKAISPLLSPYGIVYADIANSNPAPAHIKCTNNIYSYFGSESLKKYAAARNCIAQIKQRGALTSSLYALLAFLQVEAYRKQINGYDKEPLASASESARKAIELNPKNARAYQAKFGVLKTGGFTREAIVAANIAAELNPFDSDIIGDIAAFLVSIGEFDKAAPMLKSAVELNPSVPVWLDFFVFLQAEFTGDFTKADVTAAHLNVDRAPVAAIAVAMAAIRNNNKLKASRAYAALIRQEPGFLNSPAIALKRRGFSDDIVERIVAKLTQAKNENLTGSIPGNN